MPEVAAYLAHCNLHLTDIWEVRPSDVMNAWLLHTVQHCCICIAMLLQVLPDIGLVNIC